MKIAPSRRTDYGIRALIHLAQHAGTTSRADDIGAAMEIPTGFLRQILQSLQRARLVVSQPGPNGGYALARRASDVTILEVVEALEGSLTEGECALRGGPCHWDDVCALHWTWSAARRAFSDELAKVRLSDVADADAGLAAGTQAVPEDSHRLQKKRPARGSRSS